MKKHRHNRKPGSLSAMMLQLSRYRVRLKKRTVEWKALLSSRRFYCKALAGNSDSSISVNSDMTVSCNCQADDGAGRIGDLSRESLEEIFKGPVCEDFRNRLAQGKLPILNCASCLELRMVEQSKALHYRDNFTLPIKGIMVENTIHCNLQCITCTRKDIADSRDKKTLTLEDIRKVSLTLKEYGIESLAYYKYGDPFVSPGIQGELSIIRNDNPRLKISISTNGASLDNAQKLEAALLSDTIYFSIFGCTDEILQKYQYGGSFEKAYGNMKKLVSMRNSRGLSRPFIEWKYVVFNWNDRRDMIMKAIELAREAGADMISFWPTTNPYNGISWRYHTDTFFRTLGEKSWKGREIGLAGQVRTD